MNFQIKLSQEQTISQQMLQSIQILQMSSQELEHYLQTLALENPVMELDFTENTPNEDHTFEHQLQLQRNSEWLTSTDYQNIVYYQNDSENETDFWHDSKQIGEKLDEHLRSQILTKKYTNKERDVMEFLIDSLDSHGYLEENAYSISTLLGVSESLIQRMILELQSLEPAGIGAANLIECLLLQIDRLEQTQKLPSDVSAEWMRTLIRFHLSDIGRKHFHKIMRAMNLSSEEVDRCCSFLRTLNPHPANSFSPRDYIQYVTPDAFIIELDNHLEVLMNSHRQHRFCINSAYADLKDQTRDPQLKHYLQEKIRQIHSIETDIEQRSLTISRVVHILSQRQYDFFHQGPGNRKPLSLHDISSELGLHESTVSRAMQNKYLQCKWGVFPLNYFLTSTAVSSATGKEGETREHIERKIRSLIEQENKKKPLSDQAIADSLVKEGIPISRRTVNKYRYEMGIPDKSGRKTK